MAVGDAHMFPGFLTLVLTQLFFPKPPTTFLTFFRGEKQKYAGKKVYLNRVSNSQPPGHECNALTIEPPRRGDNVITFKFCYSYSQRCLAQGRLLQKYFKGGPSDLGMKILQKY